MKYYWSIDGQCVISRQELEKIREEYYPDDSMEKFMEDCSFMNNGDIEPLYMEIQRQEKLLRSVEDEAEEIRSHIAYLKSLEG